jgi:hypothetical protein
MIHEATAFLTDVSLEEPGTFVDFILSVCADLESSAKRAIHQAQSDNIRPATGVHDKNAVPDILLSEQQQPADHADNTLLNSGFDLLTETNSDSLNAQWSIPPFWNWQEFFFTGPSSPESTEGPINKFT